MQRQRHGIRISVGLFLALAGTLAFGQVAAPGVDAKAAAASTPMKLIDFREIKLSDALKIFASQSGMNIVTSPDAGKTIVSMTLTDVTARLALETLLKANNLWYKDDGGIVRVMTTQEFQRDLTNFREEKTEVFTLLYPNAVQIGVAIRDLYGDRVRLSLGSEARSDETDDLYERLDRFDAIDQRGQLLNGSSNNSNGFGVNNISTVGGGGGIGASSASRGTTAQQINVQRRRDDSAVNADRDELQKLTPDQLQALQQQAKTGDVERLFQQYRRRDADIYVTLSRRNNILAIRTSDEHALEELTKLIHRLDVPTSVVMLEVKVLSITMSKDMTSAFDFQFSDGTSSAGGFTTGDIQPPASDTLSGVARRMAPLTLGGTGVNSGNLAYQFVSNSFRARLQALEGKNRVTTLATPILMTANNEVSRLFVGEERPIVQNINSNAVVNQSTVTNGSNTAIEFRPVGTTLLITPNINADHTVTLRILQENSTINKNGASIPVVTNNGLQQQAVDVVDSQSVSGTVVAQDGLTLAIGGLIQESVSDQRSQVPLLGNIPGVGIIFRNQSKNKTRSELVILIKPRIVATPCEGENVSKELLRQLSIHPSAPNPVGTLDVFGPAEVLPNAHDK